MKYNLSLLVANALFALNFSLFVSVIEGGRLSIGAIYILETLLFGAASAALCMLFGVHLRMRVADVVSLAAMGIISALGWSYATLRGMELTSPIDAATIASVGPSLTLILAHFLGRRRLTPLRLLGLAITLAGVAILVSGLRFIGASSHMIRGNLLLTMAMAIAAVNTLIIKPPLQRYGILPVAFYYSLAACAVSLPIFWGDLGSLSIEDMRLGDSAQMLLLLLLGGALPLMLLFEGTEYLSPLHTSLYRYIQPLVTTAIVLLRGQTQLSTGNYIALAAITLGGLLMAKGMRRSS